MKGTRPALLVVGTTLGLAVACGGSLPKPAVPPPTSPVVQTMDGLCAKVRTVAADPGICPQDRKTTLFRLPEVRRLAGSTEGQEIQRALDGQAPKDQYAALVALAQRHGQPGWACVELRWLLEEDRTFLRPAYDQRFLADLDGFCRVYTKNQREIADPATRAERTARESTAQAGCAFKELLNALAGSAPADRHRLMRAAAAEAGRADWRCPAFEAASPPSPGE
jgi:hypothetical protein